MLVFPATGGVKIYVNFFLTVDFEVDDLGSFLE